jgi:hypothetical protein
MALAWMLLVYRQIIEAGIKEYTQQNIAPDFPKLAEKLSPIYLLSYLGREV